MHHTCGIRLTWMLQKFSLFTLNWNCLKASMKGMLSMSPTVPPSCWHNTSINNNTNLESTECHQLHWAYNTVRCFDVCCTKSCWRLGNDFTGFMRICCPVCSVKQTLRVVHIFRPSNRARTKHVLSSLIFVLFCINDIPIYIGSTIFFGANIIFIY